MSNPHFIQTFSLFIKFSAKSKLVSSLRKKRELTLSFSIFSNSSVLKTIGDKAPGTPSPSGEYGLKPALIKISVCSALEK